MKIYFIGIGGIGISALVQYYLVNGHKISGSDSASSEITEKLKKQGIKIYIGQYAKNVPQDANLVIYSPAVKKNNPELKEAKKLGIECLSYPEALGKLSKKYFTIAVSGTHGKSTTTAMLSLILIKAGLDPTVIVGTKLKEFSNSNFKMGKSKYLIIEACEHEQAFLNYWPKIIVITNIEKEHLDYYKNLNNILKAFKRFVGHLPKNGKLIINKDDKNLTKSSMLHSARELTEFGFKKNQKEVEKLKKILKVPGEYNIYNALAALTIARTLKIPDKTSFKALAEYTGCWRRFEIKQSIINRQQLTVISDYAHHPTEIKAILKAAREKFPKKKIWCVFQPHQYQRTFYLFNDFVKVFNDALEKNWINKLIITDVYDVAGRENKKIKKKVNSKKLVKKINKQQTIYIPTINQAANHLKKNLKGREVITIMGAGDIYTLDKKLIK